MLKYSGDLCLKENNAFATEFTVVPQTCSGSELPLTGRVRTFPDIPCSAPVNEKKKKKGGSSAAFAADIGGDRRFRCVSVPGLRSIGAAVPEQLRGRRARIPSPGNNPRNATSLLPGCRTRALLIHGAGRSISLSHSLFFSPYLYLAVDASPKRGRDLDVAAGSSTDDATPCTSREGHGRTEYVLPACLSASTLALLSLILAQ